MISMSISAQNYHNQFTSNLFVTKKVISFPIFLDEMPYLEFPLHSIFKITRKAYGTQKDETMFDIPHVNDHNFL